MVTVWRTVPLPEATMARASEVAPGWSGDPDGLVILRPGRRGGLALAFLLFC
jgi:hypothetical protein